MYISENEYSRQLRSQMRGGDGDVVLEHIVTGDALPPNVRLMARIILNKDCSIGCHVHENETESFYFVSGCGTATDNGVELKVNKGDSLITKHGDSHSIRNDGDEPLVILATIVLN